MGVESPFLRDSHVTKWPNVLYEFPYLSKYNRHLESAHHLRYATNVQQSTATAGLVCIFVCGTFYTISAWPETTFEIWGGLNYIQPCMNINQAFGTRHAQFKFIRNSNACTYTTYMTSANKLSKNAVSSACQNTSEES